MRYPVWIALVFGLIACNRSDPSRSQPSCAAGTLVARVGKVELCEADVKRAMERDPGASAERFRSPEARQELIDGLVRFELLSQAAARAGLDRDPDAIHAQQQIAVTKLVNHELAARASPDSISDADLQREYAARQATEFTVPGAAQIRHIVVSSPALAAAVVKKASVLAPSDDAGFVKLAAEYSEDPLTSKTGGDLGFIDKNSRLEPAVLAAALALKTPGEVAGPIASGQKYEILRLVQLRSAAVSPLSTVSEALRQRLYRDRRAQALDAFVAKLRGDTPVELAGAASGDRR
jgi:peptidylprolyl isomerase